MSIAVGIMVAAFVGIACVGLIVYVILRGRPRGTAGDGVPKDVPPYARTPSSVEYHSATGQSSSDRTAPKERRKGQGQDLRDVPLPRCPDCGAAIAYGEKRCPKCGKVLRPL